MCTLLIEDRPTLIAWTGQLTKALKRRKVMRVKPVIRRGEESSLQFSGEREPMRFNDHGREYKGTRYDCNRHNHGCKPEYKDRRLRAAGSGKTRVYHTHP